MKHAVFAAAFLVASPFVALADDRAPNADELSAITSALNSAGFKSWKSIELDDGKWEVDDAVHEDGKVYDVDLSKSDLSVLKKKIDTD